MPTSKKKSRRVLNTPVEWYVKPNYEWKLMPKQPPRNTRFRTKKYPDLVRMFEIREGLSLMRTLKNSGMLRKFRTQRIGDQDSQRYFRMWMVEPDNVIQVDKTIQLWIKMKRIIKGEEHD